MGAVKCLARRVTARQSRAEAVESASRKHGVGTRVPADRFTPNSPIGSLRDALQADDGQVAAPFVPLHLQLDLGSSLPPDGGLRLREP